MTSDMDTSELEPAEPANLRFLRRLVTVLTAVMIGGVVLIVALLVIRLQQPATEIALPETITLPQGAIAQSFTQGPTWFAVVTQDNRLMVFNRTTGALTQTVTLVTE